MKFLFSSLILAACSANAAPLSEPVPTPVNSPRSLEWLRERSRDTNARLRASANKEVVEALAKKAYDVERIPVVLVRDENLFVRLIDRGLGKPEDVVISETGKPDRVVFSNFELARNNSQHIVAGSISDDRKTLVVAAERNGSTDDYLLYAVDVATGRRLTAPMPSTSGDVLWLNNREIAFEVSKAEGVPTTMVRIDLTAPGRNTTFLGRTLPSKDGWSVLLTAQSPSLMVHKSGKTIRLEGDWKTDVVTEVLGVRGDDLLVQTYGPRGLGAIAKIPRAAERSAGPTYILPEGQRPLIDAWTDQGFTFALTRWGADRFLQIIGAKEQTVHEMTIPTCCNVVKIEWIAPGETMKVHLSSAVSPAKPFVYNLKTARWDSPNFAAEILRDRDVDFVTEIVTVTSSDGTKLPMRLTRRKDAVPDGRRPVYMEVYGGFGRAGHLDPSRDPMVIEFLRRGGIHAGPGIRGGNEFGPAWGQAGRARTKINTLNDLIASADWMVANKWTSPERVITAGASNGGFVVAAAALLSPQSFGLAIPMAGVHDLLSRQTLDPRFGWLREYGDPSNPADVEWMRRMSPVELAKTQPLTNFLLIAGRDDSRVNPDHTYRLMEVMMARGPAPGTVNMVDLKNAGHWGNSPGYQDLIGWRATVIRWTTIYDHLGISLR